LRSFAWRTPIAPDDVREIGDQVLALVTASGLGRGSNLALDFPSAGVFGFAGDDRLTRVRVYRDLDEGLKAVGPER
jgi:hypothetical protein